jgi:hypothetical protein
MTYVVTSGTLKATRAKEWGEEMIRACRARNITFNELGRTVNHGHTAIGYYRKGSILPRTETAIAISQALDWPRLATMIVAFRSGTCARSGCGRSFRNDGGGPKKYCSSVCLKIAANVRIAERRRRQAGQAKSPERLRSAADRRMKGVISTLQGELAVMHEYVAKMCRACEPDGLCRALDCPLRPISPLPFHEQIGEAKSDRERRRNTWTPERRERLRIATIARWARPGEREAQAARSKAWHQSATPEERSARGRKIAAARRSFHTE